MLLRPNFITSFSNFSIPSRLGFFIRDTATITTIYHWLALLIGGITLTRLLFIRRNITPAHTFSILLATTIMISPLVWPAYHIWLFIPLAFLIRDIIAAPWPGKARLAWGIPVIILYVGLSYFSSIAIDNYVRYEIFIRGVPFWNQTALWLFLLIIPPGAMKTAPENLPTSKTAGDLPGGDENLSK